MEQGWITLNRKIINWKSYNDLPVFKTWIHLLLKANYEDKEWKGQIIKRGQLITSINHLAEETGLTPKQIRRACDILEKGHEIELKKGTQNTLVTIVKYSDFQNIGSKEGIRFEKEGHTKGHTIGQQLNNNINNIISFYNKEIKEPKKDRPEFDVIEADPDLKKYIEEHDGDTEDLTEQYFWEGLS